MRVFSSVYLILLLEFVYLSVFVLVIYGPRCVHIVSNMLWFLGSSTFMFFCIKFLLLQGWVFTVYVYCIYILYGYIYGYYIIQWVLLYYVLLKWMVCTWYIYIFIIMGAPHTHQLAHIFQNVRVIYSFACAHLVNLHTKVILLFVDDLF